MTVERRKHDRDHRDDHDNDEVGVEKDVDIDVNVDIESNVDADIDLTGSVDLEFDIEDIDFDGNFATFAVDVEAFGDDSGTDLTLVVLVTDDSSSILAIGGAFVD